MVPDSKHAEPAGGMPFQKPHPLPEQTPELAPCVGRHGSPHGSEALELAVFA